MELKKVTVHRKQEKAAAVSQITLEDDYNVPDYRPDIVKILKEKGELRIDEVKAAAQAVWIKGGLVFKVLYRSDQENGKISCLRGEIPFQEKLNMDGITEYDPVNAGGMIEDISIGVIHPRKLNVRAVVAFKGSAEIEVDEKLTSGVLDAENYEQNIVKTQVLSLLFSGTDTCRQKSELVLPSSRPNVREILWKSIELRNVESYLKDGKAGVNGEVLVSVLYSEEEDARLQWYETTVPLTCSIDCDAGCEGCIYRVKAVPLSMDLEVKPDYDGEERVLVLELLLGIHVRVWKEEEIELLKDIYSLAVQAEPVWQERQAERLLIKNMAKLRLNEQMEISGTQEKVLQICACEGRVMLERQAVAENGVQAEGIVEIELLYITTDDAMPIGTAKEIYPFSQFIEVPGISGQTRLELDCGIEQLSAVMLDQEHIEVKALLHLDLMAFEGQAIQNMEEVQEYALDMEALKNCPGLVGCIAKDGDDLWSIAKENHTTVADIMETNQLTSKDLSTGQKILIVKRVG